MDFEENRQEELEELAPLLSKIPKKQQYAVPSDYFDQLSVAIFEQTIDREQPILTTTKQESSWFDNFITKLQILLLPQYRMIGVGLATVLILVVVGISILKPSASKNDLTLAEIDAYIENNIEDFDEAVLMEYASMETKTAINLEAEELEEYIEDHILEELDEQTLEELL